MPEFTGLGKILILASELQLSAPSLQLSAQHRHRAANVQIAFRHDH
ncbi:MAG: hypothetical protein QGI83_01000 [Candidatus Latescibacteria bacterium]|jgi:hypothetical protein|nr:hypothetical protein [Candidatus Latescibacterota bacterium]